MKTILIKSAEEALDTLRMTNKDFRSNGSQFIFRGQGNADWSLLPRAFRPGIRFPCIKQESLKTRTIREQQEHEFESVQLFSNLNNAVDIPNDFFAVSQNYDLGNMNLLNKVGRGEIPWPFLKSHAHLAKAQHHGMPTRFMDWSHDPYVALYFAAKDALVSSKNKLKKSKEMAIFALDIDSGIFKQYGFEEDIFPNLTRKHQRYYQYVRIVHSANGNMNAQKGVFITYVEVNFRPNDLFKPIALEDYVAKERKSETLIKYLIPTELAAEIMYLLCLHSYSADTLFPGGDGCKEGLYERDLWKDQVGFYNFR